ncbi:site-specific integrase [uncultured Sphingomonas sp.]|uniref:tyrosine-type recombinase/integrase n=1 Tax=uncultured Sphingomonas sp. TaxID=158754 RepID=UPI0025FE478F|nr:site-specific integrase [uncultured Sphingomonas sp.]
MGKLTALKIRSLTEPGRYSDGDGLFLEINGKGAASWILRVQNNGRRQDIGLGSSKVVSLKEAREAAFATRQKIAQGIDPVAERKQERQVIPTFRRAAEMVHEEHEKAWKNGKHQNQWIATLKTYAFPKMGDRLVSDIEGPLIRDVLAPIWLAKPETARRVRQRIGTVLDWSYSRGFRATEAPMRSLSKGLPRQPKKDNHFAALPYASVPDFIEKLGARVSVGRLALEALILTAARSGEIRGATWSELDLEAALWTIPAERMKMGRVHVVPLAPEAVAVFERAKKFKARACDLVFPGQNVKKPLSDMTLLKILRDMDLAVTVHGFRSAFRDWVAEQTDYSGEIAEAALAHTVSNKVEAAYRRTDFLDKRRLLMRDWSAFGTKARVRTISEQVEAGKSGRS